MPGILIIVVIPLMIILLMKIEITTGLGIVPQKAKKLNTKLSTGMLIVLLNTTRAQWWRWVTFFTQNRYPSVSINSEMTSAVMEAPTIRQIGESTRPNSI